MSSSQSNNTGSSGRRRNGRKRTNARRNPGLVVATATAAAAVTAVDATPAGALSPSSSNGTTAALSVRTAVAAADERNAATTATTSTTTTTTTTTTAATDIPSNNDNNDSVLSSSSSPKDENVNVSEQTTPTSTSALLTIPSPIDISNDENNSNSNNDNSSTPIVPDILNAEPALSNDESEQSDDPSMLNTPTSSGKSAPASTSTSTATSPTKDITFDSAIAQVSTVTAVASAPLTSSKSEGAIMAAVTAAASPLNLVGIEHKLPTNNEQSDRNGHVVSPPAVTTASAISSPTAAIDEKSMRKIWHLTGQLSTLLSRNQRNLGVLCRGADQYMTRPRQSSVISIQESPSTTTTTEYPELPLITTPAEIQQIQTENTRLKDRNRLLEDETRELTQIVREHERTLETVMDRFRAQTFMVQQAMSEMQRAHMLTLLAEQKRAVMLDQEVARLKGIIGHINNRVRYAVHLQSSLDDEEQQALTQLEAENTQLRQLLYIADDNIGNNSALATSSTSTITPVYLNASQPLIANPDKHSNQEDST